MKGMAGTEVESELERLHPASFAWALNCCQRDREVAEDVLQTSYLKILEGRALFDGKSTFKTFLFAVIRRTAAEFRRRNFLRRLKLSRWALWNLAPFDAADPEKQAETSQRHEALTLALAKLARRQREVLELVLSHDLTLQEAADTLGISVGSVRLHYERGKKRLAKELITRP